MRLHRPETKRVAPQPRKCERQLVARLGYASARVPDSAWWPLTTRERANLSMQVAEKAAPVGETGKPGSGQPADLLAGYVTAKHGALRAVRVRDDDLILGRVKVWVAFDGGAEDGHWLALRFSAAPAYRRLVRLWLKGRAAYAFRPLQIRSAPGISCCRGFLAV